MTAKTLALLWAVSLAAMALSGALFRQPGYMDAYYYYHVAANLAAGRGLVEDLIWNYLPPPGSVTHPANLYWMPLTSVAAAPGMALLGPGFRSAQAPLLLLASLVPPLTCAVIWDLWRDRGLALAAALLTLFGGFYFMYWGAVDSFGVFALVATVVLWAAARFLSQRRKLTVSQPLSPWLLGGVAGLAAAAAHLARADGFLLALAASGAFMAGGRGRAAALSACLGAYALAVLPWMVRGWSLTGGPAPSGLAATPFFAGYDDLFAYTAVPTLTGYLSLGWQPIVLSKLRALAENLVVLYGAGLMLVPLGLAGAWSLRRDPRLLPFFLYAGLLYVFMSLVFTFPGARGSMRHSAVALLPWTGLLAAHGVRELAAWGCRRFSHWDLQRARRGFTAVVVASAAVLSGILVVANAAVWDREMEHYRALAGWLEQQGAGGEPVMVTDPPAFAYASGRPAVVTPSDGPDALLQAARRYGVRYVALEAAHAAPLRPLYRGDIAVDGLQPLGWVGTTRVFLVRS